MLALARRSARRRSWDLRSTTAGRTSSRCLPSPLRRANHGAKTLQRGRQSGPTQERCRPNPAPLSSNPSRPGTVDSMSCASRAHQRTRPPTRSAMPPARASRCNGTDKRRPSFCMSCRLSSGILHQSWDGPLPLDQRAEGLCSLTSSGQREPSITDHIPADQSGPTQPNPLGVRPYVISRPAKNLGQDFHTARATPPETLRRSSD